MILRAVFQHAACAAALIVLLPACPRATPLRPFQPITPSRIWNMPERAVCAHGLAPAEAVGEIESAELAEASGVVTSPSHKGVLWMHNDSGDVARVFAVGLHGEDLGQASLAGVDNIDFEDIAAAPCPDLASPCLYVSDTGDNNSVRDHVVVYAFPEPDVDPDHPLAAGSEISQIWRFPMAAPDGPINVEAMVILPDATAMLLYEKAPTARIFRYQAPWTPDVQAVLEVTGTFTAPGSTFNDGTLPTAADMHPSGTRLALRTYGATFELVIDGAPGTSGAPPGPTADHFSGDDLVKLFDGPASEPRGEAITWDEDGTGLFLVSESPDLTPHQPLHHASCQ